MATKYRFTTINGFTEIANLAQADAYALSSGLSYEIIQHNVEPATYPNEAIPVYDILEKAKSNPSDRVARVLPAHSFTVQYLDNDFITPNLQACRDLKLEKIKEQVAYLLIYTDRVAKDQLTSLDGNLTRLNDDYTTKLRNITSVAQTALASFNTYEEIFGYQPDFSADNFSIKRVNPLEFESLFYESEWDIISTLDTKPIYDAVLSLANLIVAKAGATIVQADIDAIFTPYILPTITGYSKYLGLLGRAVAIDLDGYQLSATLDVLVGAGIINATRKAEIQLGIPLKIVGAGDLDKTALTAKLDTLLAFGIIDGAKKAEILAR